MATPVTLTFPAARFGVPANSVSVSLIRRQTNTPFISEGTFEVEFLGPAKIVDGVATLKAYASPDLAEAGFTDAYYTLSCPQANLETPVWIPRADSEDFADGDLSVLVALVPGDGETVPPPGAAFGWSPVLAVVADGARRVEQVADWVGGLGNKPASGLYVGATGLVASIADGVDVRGSQGAAGANGAGGPPGTTDYNALSNKPDLSLKADAAALGDYLAKSGNLSGLADVAIARAALGLGNSATRVVGTATGEVAAGDHLHDSRYLQLTGGALAGNIDIAPSGLNQSFSIQVGANNQVGGYMGSSATNAFLIFGGNREILFGSSKTGAGLDGTVNLGQSAYRIGSIYAYSVNALQVAGTLIQGVQNNPGQIAGLFGGAVGQNQPLILLQQKSSTGDARDVAVIDASFAVPSDASRCGRFALFAADYAGRREFIRGEADGTAPRVGFLGANAVTRQSLPEAATDAATTMALANSIRSALINLGLAQ